MALSDIIQKIADEANKKAAMMKQVADDEIKKINDEASRKAESKKQEITDIAVAKCKTVVEKAAILAKMESRSELLKEKRVVINTAYSEVESELNSMGEGDYVSLTSKMMKNASKKIPKGGLIVPKKRKKETEEAIKKAGVEYHVTSETSDFDGGFIVSTPKSEINLSFPYLIQNIVRPQTELELAKILFD